MVIVEILSILFFGGGIRNISSYFHKETVSPQGIILFESKDCLQCKKVDDFINAQAVEGKVAFTRLEVIGNNINYDILSDKAQTCGLNISQIGVPFLWDGAGGCIIGYVDVIKFFQTKISTKKP